MVTSGAAHLGWTVTVARDSNGCGSDGTGVDLDGASGHTTIHLREAVETHDCREIRLRTRCASGQPFEGRWRGVPLGQLLVEGGVSDGTTHVLIEGGDGFRACVAIRDALEGVLAIEQIGGREARVPATDAGLPRVVVPGIPGTRSVKRVVRLEAKRLGQGDDPAELERLEGTPRRSNASASPDSGI